MPVNNSWFEVYEVAPAVFAIYEPHQSEETISYLIVGRKRALLFDTGMGIGDLRDVTAQLTR
jgi:glyoxylase-like metal-dependent hydrolase (beta-lactamase superfamily II)